MPLGWATVHSGTETQTHKHFLFTPSPLSSLTSLTYVSSDATKLGSCSGGVCSSASEPLSVFTNMSMMAGSSRDTTSWTTCTIKLCSGDEPSACVRCVLCVCQFVFIWILTCKCRAKIFFCTETRLKTHMHTLVENACTAQQNTQHKPHTPASTPCCSALTPGACNACWANCFSVSTASAESSSYWLCSACLCTCVLS